MSRTFYDLPQQLPSSESESRHQYYRHASGKALNWSDLLQSPRVLIVSEAGAGKSHECKLKADELAEQGLAAFFIRLEDLQDRGMARILLPPDLDRFHSWLATAGEQAYFFLDSIDELQLTRGSLERAFRRLAIEAAGALQRMTVVVTSRPVEFDRQTFRRCLPLEEETPLLTTEEFSSYAVGSDRSPKRPNEAKAPTFREVSLAPLSDSEIRDLANLRGAQNADELLARVKQKNAEEYARRPQDLIELCDDWKRYGQIRPHADQVKTHVRVRLSDSALRDEPSNLSFERCLSGAKRLALAVVLSKRLAIRHGVASDAAQDGTPIDARTVLEDWTTPDTQTLLQRPLFGFGGYGRVRFQHRSTFEYLAAGQLHDLVRTGAMSRRALHRLLVSKSVSGEALLRPSMAPIAAWLALIDGEVFEYLLNVEPSILLVHGDPESLSPPQRAQALCAYVSRYGSGSWRGLEIPGVQVLRLAAQDLKNTIVQAWDAGIENDEVKETLLQLIVEGRIEGCENLVYALAIDRNQNAGHRLEAVRGLVALKDMRAPQVIDDIVTEGPSRLLRWMIGSLYPGAFTVENLVRTIKQLGSADQDYAGEIDLTVARAVNNTAATGADLQRLLREVLAHIRGDLVCRPDTHPHAPVARPMTNALLALSAKLCGGAGADVELMEACAMSFATAQWSQRTDEGIQTIRTHMSTLKEQERRRAFETEIRTRQQVNPAPMNQLVGALLLEGMLTINSGQDGRWLGELVCDSSSDTLARSVALRFFVRLWSGGDVDDEALATLRTTLSGSELQDEVDRLLEAMKPSPEVVAMLDRQRKHEIETSKRNYRATEAWRKFRERLMFDPAGAMAPAERVTTLAHLRELLNDERRAGRGGRWNGALLERMFGKDVVEAIRQELTKYWRTSQAPSLRSERLGIFRNEHQSDWSTLLMAVDAEAELQGWAKKLRPDEAERACRIALSESHQIAPWVEELAAAHPVVWSCMLKEVVLSELRERWPQGGSGSHILFGLRYATRDVAQPVLEDVAQWVSSEAPKQLRIPFNAGAEERIDQALQLLLAHGDPKVFDALRNLAAGCIPSTSTDSYFTFWLRLLGRVSAEDGAQSLLMACASLPVEQKGQAVRLIASAFPSRHGDAAYGIRFDEVPTDRLLDLTLMVHEHVRARDDIHHEGVFSPDDRDRAEDIRRELLNALISHAGQGGLRIKKRLAESPLFADMRDRVLYLARESLAAELDSLSADDDEIAKLYRTTPTELVPQSTTDMAQVLEDRLDDLQESMLSDASHRAVWAKIDDENSLRASIAHELVQMARGAYSVDQEAVTADGKETDIRLRTPRQLQATIELKVGEKPRSGNELRDTIRNQLVEKYMMASEARVGALVVTVSDPQRRWEHPDTGEKLDRHGLARMLETAARAEQERLGGAACVLARVLDLTPRLGPERAAKAGTPAL